MPESNYRTNPKTVGSGIVASIPQKGRCPNRCRGCFFQSGKGYLEPLNECTPNVPPPKVVRGRIVRINDGNDSNHRRELALEEYRRVMAEGAAGAFFNTAIPSLDFPGPVVLTVNPGDMTDTNFHALFQIPPNLMAVRARANGWNTDLLDRVVGHYTSRDVPVVLTFMTYTLACEIPPLSLGEYRQKVHVTNSYWCMTQAGWNRILSRFCGNKLVSTCGKSADASACRYCGVCLREYYATAERMGL